LQDPAVLMTESFSSSWKRLGRDGQFNSLGYVDKPHWFKIVLKSEEGVIPSPVIQIEDVFIDNIQVFTVNDRGESELIVQTGDNLPATSREFKDRFLSFSLPDIQTEPVTILIRVETRSILRVPMLLYERNQYVSTLESD